MRNHGGGERFAVRGKEAAGRKCARGQQAGNG